MTAGALTIADQSLVGGIYRIELGPTAHGRGLALITGVSTRSLFLSFQKSRGYAPMEFVCWGLR
jgi:hypothetical protein